MGRIGLSQHAQNARTEGFCIIRSIETKKAAQVPLILICL